MATILLIVDIPDEIIATKNSELMHACAIRCVEAKDYVPVTPDQFGAAMDAVKDAEDLLDKIKRLKE